MFRCCNGPEMERFCEGGAGAEEIVSQYFAGRHRIKASGNPYETQSFSEETTYEQDPEDEIRIFHTEAERQTRPQPQSQQTPQYVLQQIPQTEQSSRIPQFVSQQTPQTEQSSQIPQYVSQQTPKTEQSSQIPQRDSLIPPSPINNGIPETRESMYTHSNLLQQESTFRPSKSTVTINSQESNDGVHLQSKRCISEENMISREELHVFDRTISLNTNESEYSTSSGYASPVPEINMPVQIEPTEKISIVYVQEENILLNEEPNVQQKISLAQFVEEENKELTDQPKKSNYTTMSQDRNESKENNTTDESRIQVNNVPMENEPHVQEVNNVPSENDPSIQEVNIPLENESNVQEEASILQYVQENNVPSDDDPSVQEVNEPHAQEVNTPLKNEPNVQEEARIVQYVQENNVPSDDNSSIQEVNDPSIQVVNIPLENEPNVQEETRIVKQEKNYISSIISVDNEPTVTGNKWKKKRLNKSYISSKSTHTIISSDDERRVQGNKWKKTLSNKSTHTIISSEDES